MDPGNIQENNAFECPLGNGLNNADFVNIELNNTVNAYPINLLKETLKNKLDKSQQFIMASIFEGLITPEKMDEIIETYMPYAIQTTKKPKKDICLQHRILMQIFSTYPTRIVFYLIQIYLYIFNNRFTDTSFYQILSNIKRDGIIDELKYTAYNLSSPPFSTYNEDNGNDLLVNHLRAFFNIQPYMENYNAHSLQLFFGFIKSGPKHSGFMRFVSKLTKKFTSVGGHMSSFIIDKVRRIIIHFEPKGKGMSAYQPFNFKKFICRVAGIDYIAQGKSNNFNINGVEYIYMDTKSFQMVQTPLLNFDVFCQAYSILAILIYILNIEQIHSLPADNLLNLYKNINQNHAINFMNFFYDICKDDYFHIIKMQLQDSSARNTNVINFNVNGNVGGYYQKTKKYNRRRTLTNATKIHRGINKYKNKTLKQTK